MNEWTEARETEIATEAAIAKEAGTLSEKRSEKAVQFEIDRAMLYFKGGYVSEALECINQEYYRASQDGDEDTAERFAQIYSQLEDEIKASEERELSSEEKGELLEEMDTYVTGLKDLLREKTTRLESLTQDDPESIVLRSEIDELEAEITGLSEMSEMSKTPDTTIRIKTV